MKHQSPFGHLKGWTLAHFIVKAGDDFRMEALAMQVLVCCGWVGGAGGRTSTAMTLDAISCPRCWLRYL